ncbi:hypothetical protein KMP13_12810 [Epibacterium ulvae]|uniref:Pnap_2097 family protein n=1 Tax=Epibacterium ulvae TaxID=1156985 RepID=UPI001BFCD2F1|nr:Pnap_2097 family protein [Epibacterium ulvae]MBT8154751.1 hypothetical protein [Epibacterium ulvae]
MTLHTREPLAAIHLEAEVALGMAQLSLRGLSEDWWLKHLGDVHWQMIARAMGQDEPVFRDAQGRLIYAAFCATHFEQPRPDAVPLGGRAHVRSSLWQAGRSRLQSNHEVFCGERLVLRLRMVSTFVTHGEAGVNKSVFRVPPAIIPVLPAAPDDFAEEAAQKARQLRAIHREQGLNGQNLAHHMPLPDLDFNAVGLLYFPSFTRIAAEAEAAHGQRLGPVRSRLMLYFGNVEIGEGIRSAVRSETCKTTANLALLNTGGGLLATCDSQRHEQKG